MYDTAEFDALRREYLQGAIERAEHLQQQAEELRVGAQVDLKALRQEIHKLRGSGGFYGYKALSEAAARAEDTLILVLDDELDRNDQQIADLVQQVVDAVSEAAK